jgi:hypothetical protein
MDHEEMVGDAVDNWSDRSTAPDTLSRGAEIGTLHGSVGLTVGCDKDVICSRLEDSSLNISMGFNNTRPNTLDAASSDDVPLTDIVCDVLKSGAEP